LLLEGEKVTLPKNKTPRSGGGGQLHSMSIASEIDLRGMEAIDAVMTAENYIDSAVMAKMKTVTIIHGKGTGAVRNAVHQSLKKNKYVKTYRLGVYGEGEDGVTIAEFK
jgi:DNA mismatch repair protein MutS2